MLRKKLLTAAIMTALAVSLPVSAQNVALSDLNTMPSSTVPVVNTGEKIDQQHWAYRTLQNVTKKYGLLVGGPGSKFDEQKPLTRREAAVLLVNIEGKIQQDEIKLSELEKDLLASLRAELAQETAVLTGRVDKLEASDQRSLKFGFGEKFQVTGGIQARFAGVTARGSDTTPSNFSLPCVEMGVKGKIHEHLDYRVSTLPSRNINGTYIPTLLGDVYVATDIVPKHKIYFGQVRPPIGKEGVQSPFTIKTILKSQLSRNYNDLRDMGVKVQGNWKYVDYYAGVFNGNRYGLYNWAGGANTGAIGDNNDNLDFSGWVSLKPLANYPKYGTLLIGGGYTVGNGLKHYDVLGTHLGYGIGKWQFDAEYAQSKGNNGTLVGHGTPAFGGTDGRSSQGLYTQLAYKLTPKIELVAKYDTFEANMRNSVGKTDTQEFTLGTNYYLKGHNLKLQADYIYVRNAVHDNDSHKLLVQTQYAI